MNRRRRCTRPDRYLYDRRCRRVRVLARHGSRALTYRGRLPVLLLFLVLAATAITVGLFTGRVFLTATVVVVLALAWASYALRLTRITPVGPDGWPPPGGAAVREPRRPLPKAPGGAAAFPLDDEPPTSAVALA